MTLCPVGVPVADKGARGGRVCTMPLGSEAVGEELEMPALMLFSSVVRRSSIRCSRPSICRSNSVMLRGSDDIGSLTLLARVGTSGGWTQLSARREKALRAVQPLNIGVRTCNSEMLLDALDPPP
jgi:hypothetical protein